jgi:hypothetical protein
MTATANRLTPADYDAIEAAARPLLRNPKVLADCDALDVLDAALRLTAGFRISRRDLRPVETESLTAWVDDLLLDAREAAAPAGLRGS